MMVKVFLLLLLCLPLAFSQEVKVYAIVKGKVVKVFVKEGQKVEKGQPLIKIDTSIYEARKKSFLGELEEVKARLWKVDRDYGRLRELFERDLLAETRLESKKVEYDSLKARIKQIEGKIEEVETLINYTNINAPVSGKILKILTPEGSYVNGELIPQAVVVIEKEL